jgi:hypothetical protein
LKQEIQMKSLTSLKLASFITLLAVGYAGTAMAQAPNAARLAELSDAEGCVSPEMPNIPQADSATMEQMVATQGAIQSYIEVSNELLDCLDGIAEDEDLSDEDREIAIEGYNAEVEDQEALAERWNVQRTRFLEMQQ